MTNNGKVLESAGDDEHAVGRMYGLVVEEIEEMKKERESKALCCSSSALGFAWWLPFVICCFFVHFVPRI